MKKEYRKFKREQLKEKDEEKKEEKVTTTVASDVNVAIICDDDFMNLTCHVCTWVVDSGVSFHIIFWYNFFTSYTSSNFGRVKMKNDEIIKTIGIEDVCLKISVRCELLLKNMGYVSDIHLYLISIEILDDEGYHDYFGEEK